MNDYAELEIRLQRGYLDSYAVELRFTQPASDDEKDLTPEDAAPLQFDFLQLRQLAASPAAYGRALTASLFTGWVAEGFTAARRSARELGAPLRVRLFIAPSAAELHGLRWETLADPQRSEPLLADQAIWFSRYLSSDDWRRVQRRSRGELRTLVLIANPSDLDAYEADGRPLAPVDVAAELELALAALPGLRPHVLAGRGDARDRATLGNLCDRLRDGYDVLYLVCHGALVSGEPRLWLEREDGNADVVSGRRLVARLREVVQVPRLVVLASCQSAGLAASNEAADDPLAALGPEIAKAGVPAVLAMQGNVTTQTVAELMPRFFRELQQDGQIDRALTVARSVVQDRRDSWMPVLYMRLKSGHLWYAPGFRDEPGAFPRWPALVRSIRDGNCVPILGPGLTESFIGTRREIARRLARRRNVPLVLHERDDLPQVAQFLAVDQGSTEYVARELIDLLREELVDRIGTDLPQSLSSASLNTLLTAHLSRPRADSLIDPHLALAGLPFPIYITTSPGDLLTEALKSVGKQPRVMVSPWTEDARSSPDGHGDEAPDADHPLVYHAFGRFDKPMTMVLTEDDFFDYLIGISKPQRDLSPSMQAALSEVNGALVNSALLFLGFQMDDWNFRVLFRSIMNQRGASLRKRFAHVAVQMEPDENPFVKPDHARRYLETYFGDASVSVFWGNVEDFAGQLLDQEGMANLLTRPVVEA